MHPALRDAREALESTCGAASVEMLTRRDGDRWSGAQVVEHLARAYGSTAYILDKCARERRVVGTSPSAVQRLVTWGIVYVGYFPPGREAPSFTRPEGLEPAQALAAARQALVALDVAAEDALAAFGRRARVANHPLLGGFTVDHWRRFHRAHTLHHMRRLVASPAWRARS